MFSPSSRTVSPKAAFDLATGNSAKLGSVSLTSAQSGVYYDFGLEVGGVATIKFSVSSTDGNGALGIAFTEAKDWIGRVSDSSSGIYAREDGALYANFSSTGTNTYTMPVEQLRGGFRYMTLFLDGATSSVTINDVSLELSFQPTWSNLRAYQGYFHSNDDLLNKIWYSGAYVSVTKCYVLYITTLTHSVLISLSIDSPDECASSFNRKSLACPGQPMEQYWQHRFGQHN